MPLLEEHGVVSGMSVIVHGDEEPYGVLGVHTNRKHRFSEEDVLFLQSVANLVALAMRRQKADQALHESDLRKLISMEPDNAHAYNALGYTLADQTDRYQEALELIEKALELKPNDPFIMDSMGWVQYRLGNHQLAIDYLERAFDIREDAEIAAHLGEVLWIVGDRQRAEAVWNRALEQAPANDVLLGTIRKLKQ